MNRVCTGCIGDEDLKVWIREQEGGRGCDYCETHQAPTADLENLCNYITSCIGQYWGTAVEQLPYESREGGYQAETLDTYDVLFEEIMLELPRDRTDRLRMDIISCVEDELWCAYDWLTLDQDEAMISSWSRFCEKVKHDRRFFFMGEERDPDDRDSYTPLELLQSIARYSQRYDLIQDLPAGTVLYRARDDMEKPNPQADQYGPPPTTVCQSNRMNPAGIPMFYGSFTRGTAVSEVKAKKAAVGRFTTKYSLRLLDLTRLPRKPGYFAPVERDVAMQLSFLNHFSSAIMKPVERDNLVHVDYAPSQIVTEYLRDYPFSDGPIDGVLYGSVAVPGKKNVVLFLDTLDARAPSAARGLGSPLKFTGANMHKLTK